jgi:hypothetical protein
MRVAHTRENVSLWLGDALHEWGWHGVVDAGAARGCLDPLEGSVQAEFADGKTLSLGVGGTSQPRSKRRGVLASD